MEVVEVVGKGRARMDCERPTSFGLDTVVPSVVGKSCDRKTQSV